jgi:transcriptional regulator with XRE-family HTH domain
MTDSNVDGIHGEYRRFTSDEVGRLIRWYREHLDIKRAVLAAAANMSEKTLERAEAGQGISEEYVRRIARALGIDGEILVSELFVPAFTPDEVERFWRRRIEDLDAKYSRMVVAELKGVRDALKLFNANALLADDKHVAEQDMLAFAELKQSCMDSGDVGCEMEEQQLVQAGQSFLAEVRSFEQRGYVLRYGVTQGFLSDKTPYSLAVLVAFRRPMGTAGTPVEVLLPKKMLNSA